MMSGKKREAQICQTLFVLVLTHQMTFKTCGVNLTRKSYPQCLVNLQQKISILCHYTENYPLIFVPHFELALLTGSYQVGSEPFSCSPEPLPTTSLTNEQISYSFKWTLRTFAYLARVSLVWFILSRTASDSLSKLNKYWLDNLTLT